MDVFVCQGVVDEFPGTPELDQVGVAEDPELVGDGRLAHAEGALKLTDREVFPRKEGAEYAHPGKVADHLQEIAGFPRLQWGGRPVIRFAVLPFGKSSSELRRVRVRVRRVRVLESESAELVGFGFCISTIVYRRRSPLRLLLRTFIQRYAQGFFVAVAVYDGDLGGVSRLVVAQGSQ